MRSNICSGRPRRRRVIVLQPLLRERENERANEFWMVSMTLLCGPSRLTYRAATEKAPSSYGWMNHFARWFVYVLSRIIISRSEALARSTNRREENQTHNHIYTHTWTAKICVSIRVTGEFFMSRTKFEKPSHTQPTDMANISRWIRRKCQSCLGIHIVLSWLRGWLVPFSFLETRKRKINQQEEEE